ncbi:MAG: type II toxin-antitoxin system RelE/ParE family toxin [Blastocatellia bacterium]
MNYQVGFTENAKKHLAAIQDRRIRQKIVERAQELAIDPEKQGKDLGGDLEGYRSVRAVGQRYRIVYLIDNDKVIVVVVSLGIRKEGDKKDVYKLTQRLFKLGLLLPPDVEEEHKLQEESINNQEPQEDQTNNN